MSWHRPTRSRSARARFTPRVEALETRDTPTAGVRVLALTSLFTTENGGASFIRFNLTQRPTANVAFSLTTSDPTEGRPFVPAVVFTPANWNVPQVVRMAGLPDRTLDGNIAYRITTGPTVSADPQYRGKAVADIPLTNVDNGQQAALVVTTVAGAHTTEAGRATVFSVRLAVKPIATVTVPLQSSDLTEGRLSRGGVTFTPLNWNVPQVVTVRGIDDLLKDGNRAYTIRTLPALGLDPAYLGLNGPDVALVNRDNEPPVTLADFDGTYTGTYAGQGSGSGAVRFSVVNGVITVAEPSGGSGGLQLTGPGAFSASVGVYGVPAQFFGPFRRSVTGVITATGTFFGEKNVGFDPMFPILIFVGGTWEATRLAT